MRYSWLGRATKWTSPCDQNTGECSVKIGRSPACMQTPFFSMSCAKASALPSRMGTSGPRFRLTRCRFHRREEQLKDARLFGQTPLLVLARCSAVCFSQNPALREYRVCLASLHVERQRRSQQLRGKFLNRSFSQKKGLSQKQK